MFRKKNRRLIDVSNILAIVGFLWVEGTIISFLCLAVYYYITDISLHQYFPHILISFIISMIVMMLGVSTNIWIGEDKELEKEVIKHL